MPAETALKFETNPTDKPPLHDLQGDGPLPDAAAVERVRAARDGIVNRPSAVLATAIEEEAETQPIEDIESVEVQLPNGRIVLFGPPATPASLRVAQMLGTQASGLLVTIVSTLLYVREIDGQAVRPVGDLVTAQAMLNQLGDDGLDILGAVYQECWPALTRSALPILKKKYRVG